uniref:C-type lectin domain-containing protein n=1 Tax=Eutreptiella gymnastica TaxID=73025 RepID=A0A7S1J663_9EUGL
MGLPSLAVVILVILQIIVVMLCCACAWNALRKFIDESCPGGDYYLAIVAMTVLILSCIQVFFLAGASANSHASKKLQYEDTCPDGWATYHDNCYLWNAEPRTQQEAAEFCLNENADLLSLDVPPPEGSMSFGIKDLEASGSDQVWTGLIKHRYDNWTYLSNRPAQYRPWHDAAYERPWEDASFEGEGPACATLLPYANSTISLGMQPCAARLPFVCQRPIMPSAVHVDCFKALRPSLRWNKAEWLQFSDDWYVNTAAAQPADYIISEGTWSFCVAPIQHHEYALLHGECDGYSAVAVCDVENQGVCQDSSLNKKYFEECGWYLSGGPGTFARVQRAGSVYAVLDAEVMAVIESVALNVAVAANITPAGGGLDVLVVNWLPEESPYSIPDKAEYELWLYWMIFAGLAGTLFIIWTLCYGVAMVRNYGAGCVHGGSAQERDLSELSFDIGAANSDSERSSAGGRRSSLSESDWRYGNVAPVHSLVNPNRRRMLPVKEVDVVDGVPVQQTLAAMSSMSRQQSLNDKVENLGQHDG